MRFLALVLSLCAVCAFGNAWVDTNDVLAIASPVARTASVSEMRLTVFVRQGTNAIDLTGCTSRWSFVDARDGYEVASYAGTTLDATNGQVRFVAALWSRSGTFTATARIYPPSLDSFIASALSITVTSSSPVVVNVSGGGASVSGVTSVVTSGVQSVAATNGLVASGSNVVMVALDTSSQIGAGSLRMLLLDTGGGVTSFYWSSAFVTTTGGINVQYFTNVASYGTLASTVTVDQTWMVPGGVTQVAIKCWGGGGGGGSTYAGGAGGFAFNVVPVTPGESLTVRVGQGGRYDSTTQALPGGGAATSSVNRLAGNGGGYSAVLRGTNILALGGGGGGGSYANNSTVSGIGGSGGGSSGQAGGFYALYPMTMAAGGTQTNGGTSGTNANSSIKGRDGAWLSGGTAAYLNSSYSGGHGGGGYYGGGGGGYTNASSGSTAGGAGGSCFAPAPYGVLIRGNNSGDDDWQASWGAGGTVSNPGADGRVLLRWQ